MPECVCRIASWTIRHEKHVISGMVYLVRMVGIHSRAVLEGVPVLIDVWIFLVVQADGIHARRIERQAFAQLKNAIVIFVGTGSKRRPDAIAVINDRVSIAAVLWIVVHGEFQEAVCGMLVPEELVSIYYPSISIGQGEKCGVRSFRGPSHLDWFAVAGDVERHAVADIG